MSSQCFQKYLKKELPCKAPINTCTCKGNKTYKSFPRGPIFEKSQHTCTCSWWFTTESNHMYLPELWLVPGLTESRGYTQIALCCVFVISYYKLDHWIMQFQSFHCLSHHGTRAIIPCFTNMVSVSMTSFIWHVFNFYFRLVCYILGALL